MQIQMETCDLDHCDFVETQFHLYESEMEFYASMAAEEAATTHDTNNNTVTQYPGYRGVLLYFIRKITDLSNIDNSPHYVYMPIHIRQRDDVHHWILEQKKNLQQEFTLYEIQYWYLEKFSCVYVKRNREWFHAAVPKLQEVWKTIEKERESGYSHRFPKKKMATKIEVIHGKDENTHIHGMPVYKPVCLIKLDSLDMDSIGSIPDGSEEVVAEEAV